LCNISVLSPFVLWYSSQECSSFALVISPIFYSISVQWCTCFPYIYFLHLHGMLWLHFLDYCISFSGLVLVSFILLCMVWRLHISLIFPQFCECFLMSLWCIVTLLHISWFHDFLNFVSGCCWGLELWKLMGFYFLLIWPLDLLVPHLNCLGLCLLLY
jgi:hypothetical protein